LYHIDLYQRNEGKRLTISFIRQSIYTSINLEEIPLSTAVDEETQFEEVASVEKMVHHKKHPAEN